MGRLDLRGVRGALRALAAALSVATGLACAQQDATLRLDSDPPLPPPTEAQLARGRELLGKIVHVIEHVSLYDASAVLGVFGFTDLETFAYSKYVRVMPRPQITRPGVQEEYLGSGLTDLESSPSIRDVRIRASARFSGGFNTRDACVAIDDVERQFAAAPERRTGPFIVKDRFSTPRRAHDIGKLSFKPLATPYGFVGQIGFGFDYQVCAVDFGFIYFPTHASEALQ